MKSKSQSTSRAGRLLPKPKGRAAQLRWAETLGMDALGWIHGGTQGRSSCCGWNTYVRQGNETRCICSDTGQPCG